MRNPRGRMWLNVTGVCVLAGLVAMLPAMAGRSVSAQEVPPSGSAQSPTAEDLEALAARIENDQGREQLLSEIRALIALQKQKPPTAPERPLSEQLAEAVTRTAEETSQALSSLDRYLPHRQALTNWIQNKILDPEKLSRLSRRAMPAVLILAMAWIAEFIAERLLGRFRKRIENRARQGLAAATLRLAGARAALRFCAPAVFALLAFTAFFFLRPGPPIGNIAVEIVAVYTTGRFLVILTRMVLAPSVAPLRLAPLRNGPARSLFSWTRRLIIVALAGYLVGGAALLFGLPARGFAFLMNLLGLVLLAMMIVAILRNRTPMAEWIRGPEEGAPAPRSFSRRVRTGLAAIWHILAIFYLIGVFVVWWRNIEGGFLYLARGTLLSVLVLFVARLTIQGMRAAIVRSITANDHLRENFPILAQRLNRYAPAAVFLLRTAVTIVAGAAILAAWKVDVHAWLAEPFVRRLGTLFFTVFLVAVIAAAIWEVMNIATEHYLAKPEKAGYTPGHSARVRTLLPLMRKALGIGLSVIVVMIVLSEIGVDIGPLLAGAGIIGLAVGFGSQKLVQDIITGVFILLEDAVAVGDVVQVAGIGGLVEDLSIRSIRLRDLSGNVHTIPFSSVGTVTNMTRLYSYYLLDIGVAYREDTDQVAAVCRDIVEDLRSDPQFGPDILEPLEVLGVDQFADSAVILKARIKTRPIRQWAVGREFNRRMKKRFDELGIEIPFPHRTLYFGADKNGSAPPAHLVVEQK